MSKEFRKYVNLPHKIAGAAQRAFTEWQPDTKTKKAARAAGISAAAMARFALWAVKYLALDNHALRALENKLSKIKLPDGRARAIAAFHKKFPNSMAHVYYWAILAVALHAGDKLDLGDKMIDGIKSVWSSAKDDLDEWKSKKEAVDFTVHPTDTYQEFLQNINPIMPHLAATVVLPESFRSAPYTDSKGIWTIGFGSTVLSDGTKVSKDTSPITESEAYAEVEKHIRDREVFMTLYVYCCHAGKPMGYNEILSFGNTVYNSGTATFEGDSAKIQQGNRWHEFRKMYRADSLTRAAIDSMFVKYPLIKTSASPYQSWANGDSAKVCANKFANYLAGGGGLEQHRWMEACLLTGDLQACDLLDAPVGYFNEWRESQESLITRGDPRTVKTELAVKFQDWKNRSKYNKKRKVGDFLPPAVVALVGTGKVDNSRTLQWADAVAVANKDTAELAVLPAQIALQEEKFDSAVIKYRAVIAQDKNNLAAYSDLTYALVQDGDYDGALSVAADFKALNVAKDKKTKAGVYYNAGLARQHKAESAMTIDDKIKNYKLAIANFKTASENLPKVKIYKIKIAEMEAAVRTMETSLAQSRDGR
ncbi:MAG: hypothetical protein LBO08_02405 [Rickettsiales bacterium]|jgi:GH24 family phage-related lysozyme (muramidase)/tetratricopeptide (TPR) repeat protein|nr:hypothetical protein [Rickettsiales bacterium]